MVDLPNFNFEQRYWKRSLYTVGIDEVGYGALAGPLYVGLVCFETDISMQRKIFWDRLQINDSKLLTPQKRAALYSPITSSVTAYAVVSAGVEVINKYGIVYARDSATHYGVKIIRQLLKLENNLIILTDAFKLSSIDQSRQHNIIKGDCKCLSIAAASVIAKVLRDRYMEKIAQKYSHYNWERNKGYGTLIHREAILKHGKTIHHRNLYIRKILKLK